MPATTTSISGSTTSSYSDRQYSCAYFEYPGQSLEDAQTAKKRHIAAKLLPKDGGTALDIGCGLGGLGLYLAGVAGARVTGVTLSEEQFAVATERARQTGLADRVEFRLQDYRDVAEKFDRIVSVGMFEHVGVNRYDEFFTKVRGLLKDDGVMMLHSIGRNSVPGRRPTRGSANIFSPAVIFPACPKCCRRSSGRAST